MSKDNKFEHLATVISNSCERHGIDLREPEKDLLAIDVLGAIFGANQMNTQTEIDKAYKEGYEKGAEEMRLEAKKPIEKFIKQRERQAVKEFSEKLKGKLHDFGDGGEKGAYITEKEIDELLKEYEQ